MAKKKSQIQGAQILNDDSYLLYYEERRMKRNTEVGLFAKPLINTWIFSHTPYQFQVYQSCWLIHPLSFSQDQSHDRQLIFGKHTQWLFLPTILHPTTRWNSCMTTPNWWR